MRRPAPAAPALALAAGLVVALLTGCSTEAERAAEVRASESTGAPGGRVPFPAELTAYVDQSRFDRVGRNVFVRLVNAGEHDYTVTRAEVVSERHAPVTWTGEETFHNEADLDFDLPTGSCGTGSDAEVTVTYRVDGGPEVVSTTRATDRYGALALFLDRDCAQQTLAEAADLVVGEPRVVGTGRASYLELPVVLTATGERDDVAFAGFERTVLFSLREGSTVYPGATPVMLRDGVTSSPVLRIVPSRCDPHALAEDKVGTLIGVHVQAPGLADNALFHLPLSDEERADLRRFWAAACGLDGT